MSTANEANPTPPTVPPQISAANVAALPLGHDPAEQAPIPGVLTAVESLLRQPRRVMYRLRQTESGSLIAALVLIALVCSLGYGVVVGTFSGGIQLWAAPIKVAAGLFISALICLPSLYVFSCLGGSRASVKELFGLVAGLLTLMTVLLISFAPVAWIFSQSTKSVVAMGALHLVFWFVATYFGVRFLNAGFAHHQDKSSGGLSVWVLIFVMVMLQMTTALRPIVGTADTLLPVEKKFFVTHWVDSLIATK
ncbi:MAG: hypothetical protein DME26_08070 [Verrucomicrobia bacterium]|nr:MAG: hypothetical protein DME26_08070 [Verrucomicrobiota bacterium]